MKNRWSILALVPFLITGCMAPPGLSANAPTTSRESHTDTIASLEATDPISIRVGDETLEPMDIVQRMEPDLTNKANTLSPQQFRLYIEQAALQNTTDRLSEMLLYQQAANRLTPQIEENINHYVDGEIRKTVTSQYGGVQRLYEKELASRGRSLEDERRKMRREIIVSSYLDAEIKPRIVEPSRAELLAAFQANMELQHKSQRRRMSLIDVRVLDYLPRGVREPDRTEMDQARQKARTTIEYAVKEIQDGSHFSDVARKHSNGLHASEGGTWGWISKGSVRERFEPVVEVLYTLKEGEVSDILETQDGFFLVHCDEIETQNDVDFQRIQPELTKRYYQTVYLKLINEHIDSLRRNAGIDVSRLEQFRQAVVKTALNKYTSYP